MNINDYCLLKGKHKLTFFFNNACLLALRNFFCLMKFLR